MSAVSCVPSAVSLVWGVVPQPPRAPSGPAPVLCIIYLFVFFVHLFTKKV